MPSIFLAQPLPHVAGFTWTPASRLREVITDLESWIGPRDSSFTILGVELVDGPPRIWFPGGSKDIVIQLSAIHAENPTLAYWQLAHECVHLLSPVVAGDGSTLEEGLATDFAEHYARTRLGLAQVPQEAAYASAQSLVQRAEAHQPGFSRSVYATFGRLSKLAPSEVVNIAPSVPADVVDGLCAPFR